MASEQFRDWAEKVVRKAIEFQDKTFRQLVEEKIVPSWAEYFLKKS